MSMLVACIVEDRNMNNTVQRSATDRSVRSAPAERSFLGTFFGGLRRTTQRESRPTGIRQAVPSYNLEFPKLRDYLESVYGNVEISKNVTLMEDKFVFYLPKPLGDEQMQEIEDLRERRAASLDMPDAARQRTDGQQITHSSPHLPV